MKKAVLLLFLAFLLSGCSFRGTAGRSGVPDVVEIRDSDLEMNAAIEQAQDTLERFTAALGAPKPNQIGFSVKARFRYNQNDYEHIWLENVAYKDGRFTGRLANEPLYVKDLAYGELVTVARSEVTDWMFIEDGKLVGGYTIRVLYKRLSPAERKKFDQEARFVIEP